MSQNPEVMQSAQCPSARPCSGQWRGVDGVEVESLNLLGRQESEALDVAEDGVIAVGQLSPKVVEVRGRHDVLPAGRLVRRGR